MMLLTKSHNESWIGVRETAVRGISPRSAARELEERLYGVQLWLCDLDDNHTPSPAKRIAREAVGTHRLSPRYWQWCAGTAWALLTQKEGAESARWLSYIQQFLDAEARQELRAYFTPDRAFYSLYPGISSLYASVLRHSTRIYVTRNIAEVVDSYARILGFSGAVTESFCKGKAVDNLLQKYPWAERIGVDGDSEEDAEMVRAIRQRGKTVVAIQSMEQPREGMMNPDFDYAVSKSREGLVRLLTAGG